MLGLTSDEYASWRWHVTPRERGKRQLQLIVSARTVGADGLTAETALPDQVIDVRVRINYADAERRWMGWGVAAVIGGLLARFGEGAFDVLGSMIVAGLSVALAARRVRRAIAGASWRAARRSHRPSRTTWRCTNGNAGRMIGERLARVAPHRLPSVGALILSPLVSTT